MFSENDSVCNYYDMTFCMLLCTIKNRFLFVTNFINRKQQMYNTKQSVCMMLYNICL